MKSMLSCMLAAALLATAALADSQRAAPVQKAKLKLAMFVWRGETEAEKAFVQGLQQAGYQLEITIYDAGQNPGHLRALLGVFEKRVAGFDLVYSFGTTASKAVKTALAERKPQIFTIVAAPVESGLVPSLEASGANLAGASNMVPLETQLDNARGLFAFNRLGVLVNTAEENSCVVADKLARLGARQGFAVERLDCQPTEASLRQALAAATNAKAGLDALYLPNDSFLVSQAKPIGAALRSAKLKSVASVRDYIEAGALAGTVADYHKLGLAAATLALKALRGGSLKDSPVILDREPALLVNRQTAAELKVAVPAGLKPQPVLVP